MNQSKSDTQSQQTTSPWAPQASALTNAFTNAQSAYGKASDAVAPNNFTAQMTPEQLATFQQMVGYGGSNPTPGVESATAQPMFGAGSSGTLGALTGLGAFDPSATNNPAAIAAGANTYANGIDIPGQVQAAMRDATNTARDVTLPGMESAAAGSGNINGSRTGLAEGLVQRDLANKAADTSATLRGNAYNTGAGLTAESLGLNNSAKLGALTGAGGLGIGTLNAAQSLGSGAINDQGNLFTLAGQGGAGLQQNNQLGLTNQAQQYQSQVSSPYDSLNGLMSIIGSNNWGSNSSGTSNTTTTPSAFQTIGGLAFGLGGLMRSDRNSKTDIVRIGALDDGTPVYRYRYKNVLDHRVYIGLMAQDVEEKTPDAVMSIWGTKHVNYDLATRHLIRG